MSRGSPPQGRLRDHDHSRAGEGGSTIDVGEVTADDVNLEDGDTLDFGTDDDVSLKFDPAVGANGAFVLRDERAGAAEDRLVMPLGAALQLAGQNLDLNSQDLVDGAQTIYDAAAGEIPNTVVEALANLAADEQFSAYPISIDTDSDASGGANITIAANGAIAVSPQGAASGLNADTLQGQTPSQLGGGLVQQDRQGNFYISTTLTYGQGTIPATYSRSDFVTSFPHDITVTQTGVTYNGTIEVTGRCNAQGGAYNVNIGVRLYIDGTEVDRQTKNNTLYDTVRAFTSGTFTNVNVKRRCFCSYGGNATHKFYGNDTGTLTKATNPTTTRGPMWVSGNVANAGGGTVTSAYININGQQTATTFDWLFGTITPSDTVTVGWTATNLTTPPAASPKFYEGKYAP